MAEHLLKKCDVRLPVFEVDSSTICLETLLNRMMHIKRSAAVFTTGAEVRAEEIKSEMKPSAASNFFAFPSSASNTSTYLPPAPSKYYEPRRNVSIERDIGVARKSQISPTR